MYVKMRCSREGLAHTAGVHERNIVYVHEICASLKCMVFVR